MHADALDAPRPCQRCGTYDELRSAWTQSVCRPCFARVVPAGTWAKLRVLIGDSVVLARGSIRYVFLSELLLSTPWEIAQHSVNRRQPGYWLLMVLSSVANTYASAVGVHLLVQRARSGQRPHVGLALRAARVRVLSLAAYAVFEEVATLIGIMLLVVPGLWLSAAIMLVVPILVLERTSLKAAFSESMRRMRGQKLAVSLVLLVVIALVGPLTLTENWAGSWYPVLYAAGLFVVSCLNNVFLAALYLQTLPWEQRSIIAAGTRDALGHSTS